MGHMTKKKMHPEKKHWLSVSIICIHIIITMFVHRLRGEGLEILTKVLRLRLCLPRRITPVFLPAPDAGHAWARTHAKENASQNVRKNVTIDARQNVRKNVRIDARKNVR